METNVKSEKEKELWNSPTVEVLSIKDETKGGQNSGDDFLEQS
jgi:hypothetical protein